MTIFRLLFGKRVMDSVDSLDRELKDYFRESASFRSRVRNGTVVIVDETTVLFDFLSSLTQSCKLKFQVVHVDDVENARKMLGEIGQSNVKVIVISSGLFFESANGVALAKWVNEWLPEVPVWVSDCSPEMEDEVHGLSRRIGILHKGSPLAGYIDILGFPTRCREQTTKHLIVN
jgi:hypothetical protein